MREAPGDNAFFPNLPQRRRDQGRQKDKRYSPSPRSLEECLDEVVITINQRHIDLSPRRETAHAVKAECRGCCYPQPNSPTRTAFGEFL